MLKLLFACALVASVLLGGCGPNDRLRDTYTGKPQNHDTQPIERDNNGNPILPPQK